MQAPLRRGGDVLYCAVVYSYNINSTTTTTAFPHVQHSDSRGFAVLSHQTGFLALPAASHALFLLRHTLQQWSHSSLQQQLIYSNKFLCLPYVYRYCLIAKILYDTTSLSPSAALNCGHCTFRLQPI